MIDREQIRRDANRIIDRDPGLIGDWAYPMAAYCLTLLTELEQAEREAAKWRDVTDLKEQAERERDELKAAEFAWRGRALAAQAKLRRAEARLAEVQRVAEEALLLNEEILEAWQRSLK